MTDTLRLALIKPVTFPSGEKGVTYEHLDLAEPTAGQLEKAAAANGITSNIILIAEVAKVPLGAVRLLCKRDLEGAVKFLSSFTNGDQPTTDESLQA